MKKFLYLLLSGVPYTNLCAQDIITLIDGSRIETKIIKITKEEFEYKKFSYIDGPSYIIPVRDIDSVQFSNGEVEHYAIKKYVSTPNNETATKNETPKNNIQNKPTTFNKVDIKNYHGFLLAKGNNVYIPDRPTSYEQAAVNRLRRLLYFQHFWNVVPSEEQAHFIIKYEVNTSGMDHVNEFFLLRRDDFNKSEMNSFALCHFLQKCCNIKASKNPEDNVRAADMLYYNLGIIQGIITSRKQEKWMQFYTK